MLLYAAPSDTSGVQHTSTVTPLTLGPGNTKPATGLEWRHVRDLARCLGVPLMRAGRKLVVRADLFIAALESQKDKPSEQAAEQLHPEEAAARVRAMLGKRLVNGGGK